MIRLALFIFLTWGVAIHLLGQEVKTYGLFVANNQFETFEALDDYTSVIKKINKTASQDFGFTSEFLENITSLEFLTKLRALSQKEYARNDQVLIYISSRIYHDSLFNMRYVLFKGSSHEDFSSMLSLQELLVMLGNVPCRHLVLIMDCGPIWDFDKPIDNTAYMGITTLDGYAHDDVSNRLIYRTRKYIYLKSDISEDRKSFHSAMYSFLADKEREDNVAGLKDLIRHLQKEDASSQIRIGPFMNDEPAGEFLFQYQ